MTSAFAAATATLSADANLGHDATHYQAGSNLGLEVRVRLAVPDVMQELGAAPVVIGDVVINAAVADLPEPAEGDTFAIGDNIYRVMAVLRDAAGVTWRMPCRRNDASTVGSLRIGAGI